MNRGFGSDNHSGVLPEILHSLSAVNIDHAPSYGTDEISEKCTHRLKQIFGNNCDFYFVFNGTAANVLCLQALVKSFNSVLCSEHSHLTMDECGAPEKHIGCKLLPIKATDGKIKVNDLESSIIRLGDQHFSQVKAISITQPTELGTLYSKQEMLDLKAFADKHNLLFHIDGARLIYGAQNMQLDFNFYTQELKADAISFGGTKNGLLFGEIVILNNNLAKVDFKFIRKQYMQLPSKMRFIAQQFLCLLGETDELALWPSISKRTHELAQYLSQKIEDISEIQITQKVQANSVFVRIPKSWLKPLREKFFFYVWDQTTWEMRWMISFDTTKEDIDSFINHIYWVKENVKL